MLARWHAVHRDFQRQAARRRSRCLFGLAQTTARVGQWLLPWTCTLILSATIVHALEAGLARTLSEPTPIVASTTGTSDAGCYARGGGAQDIDMDPRVPVPPRNKCPLTPAEPGAHWRTLGAVESDGSITSLSCLVRPDRVVGCRAVRPRGGRGCCGVAVVPENRALMRALLTPARRSRRSTR
jgi:hypothetical protein